MRIGTKHFSPRHIGVPTKRLQRRVAVCKPHRWPRKKGALAGPADQAFLQKGSGRLAVENGQEDLLQVWASADNILLEELQSGMNTGRLLITDSLANSRKHGATKHPAAGHAYVVFGNGPTL